MGNVNITLTGEGLQDVQELNIQVSIAATVNVTAKTARRQATSWLVSEVGNMLVGGTPQLVISQKTAWRVPVILTSSAAGPVGEVGMVEIDAENGQLLVGDELRERILDNVRDLTRPASAAAG
jgi:hypothetical protein